jgi:hypothetical protein
LTLLLHLGIIATFFAYFRLSSAHTVFHVHPTTPTSPNPLQARNPAIARHAGLQSWRPAGQESRAA